MFRRVCRKRQAVLMAAAFLVEKRNMERHHLSQSKYEAMTFATACNAERRCYKRLNGRKNCIGKGFRSSIHCRKTECGAAILAAERNMEWVSFIAERDRAGGFAAV